MEDILKAKEKINAMPKGKWMLVAPDGRVWADEKPAAIMQAMVRECSLGELIPSTPFAADPLDEPYSRTLGSFNVGYGR